ncbi:MAG TPA: hypothetical protein VNL37_03880, partial [Candidatus Polarisedimenticolia bacterium]|nr:hypothetical protein [Candidatus Polarisedimenticolia bacterium]
MANAGNAGAAGANPAPGTPPDISQMSPRERFLRLQDRVERAAESGDSATARQFAPMAIAAYGMLDSFDVDVRFHAGIMHTELGQFPEAAALADTIEAADRGNLLGEILRMEIARARRDSTALARNRRAFLAAYDRQIARARPEYQEHQAMLEDYHRRLAGP